LKWADKKSGGRIYKFLRTKGKKYRSKGVSKDRRGQIKNAVRPKIVDEKSRIGDWEIDTLIGKNHKQALVAIVERKSKFSLMRKVGNKTAELVRPDKDRVLTLTADRGKEFDCHEKVAKALECDYYFAPPYSCWQPGLNENTNGLIRQFLPKKSRFEEVAERISKESQGVA